MKKQGRPHDPEGTRKRRKVPDGYVIVIKVDGHYVLEHRHRMEKKLGRKLRRNEEVHHRNEDRSDNRMRNLKLMTKSKHSSIHATEQHRNKNFGRHTWTEKSKQKHRRK